MKVVDGMWPSLIGVPTGLGKTACIDIAVWALAADADRAPPDRLHRRRIWYVVNRRLIVDTAANRAVRLAEVLANSHASGSAVAAVADRLGALGGLGEQPLHVATLRGGANLGSRPPDPAQPAIILATPAMYGSRWLFRGFGTSTGMRPIEAGLAGTDSLVLLDEAHLARPLRRLEAQTTACDRGRSVALLPGGRGHVRFVELTATGDRSDDRFDLDDDDLRHPVVVRRLDAAKPVRLAPETTVKRLADALTDEVLRWLDGLSTHDACLVFCNDPRTARAVHGKVNARLAGRADVLLLTGRVREREAKAIRAAVLDAHSGAPAGSPAIHRARPLVVVATQTLEVGADLDVDHLITQSAGARAVVQRLGRLNRLGDKPLATGAIVHASDGDGGIYGEEAAEVWERLLPLVDGARTLSLSPRHAAERIGIPTDTVQEPPSLLPGLLWEWAKTTVTPPGEAPVEVFIEGRDESRRRVQVCWRAVIEPYLTTVDDEDAEHPKLIPPVAARETIELPLYEVQADLGHQTDVARLSPDRSTLERVLVSELRSGDTVVLSVADGRYDRFGWNPEATEPVPDVSLLEGTAFPLVTAALANLVVGPAEVVHGLGKVLERLARTAEEDDEKPTLADLPDEDDVASLVPLDRERLSEVMAGVRSHLVDGGARSVTPIERPVNGVAYLRLHRRAGMPSSAAVRIEALEELSFGIEDGPGVTSPVLRDHLHHVGSTARHLAEAIGLAPDLVAACARAGALHDIGKHDDRFQRWVAPDGDQRGTMAKSTRSLGDIERLRRSAGWPKGGRHETLSLRLVRASYDQHPAIDHDADLVLHLVVSHHGHGRPSLPPCDDSIGGVITAVIDGHEFSAPASLALLDWDQPARFRRLSERYGLWGLALLEAVVRQADHAVSKVAAT
jgi:CRISPR-associated endonuclease/helicase Cas3